MEAQVFSQSDLQSQFGNLSLQAFTSFASLADLQSNPGGSNVWESKVHDTLKLFEKLWCFQTEHREALFRSGVTPRHIGDIAMRCAQLHFGLYMHSGSPDRLVTAQFWLEGIIARGYFDQDHPSSSLLHENPDSNDSGSTTKRLRVYARFILALLFLDRREESWNLLLEVEAMMAASGANQDAAALVNEISNFLASDVGMPVPISPGSKLVFRPNLRCPRPHPDSPLFSNHVRRVRDAVFISHIDPGLLKIADLSLDSYRMMMALEWRDEKLSSSTSAPGSLTMSPLRGAVGLAMPNRHQRHQTRSLQIISLLGSLLSSLPPPPGPLTPTTSQPDLTLIHIVGKGYWGQLNIPTAPTAPSSLSSSPLTMDSLSLDESKVKAATSNLVKLPLGVFVSSPSNSDTGTETSESLITPDDLFPFTRRRMLLIVDSDASSAFLSPQFVRGCSSLAPMSLLSPSHRPTAFLSSTPTGSIFTLGLTCPLMAFCLLMGEKKPIESAKVLLDLESAINKAESRIAEALVSPLSSPTSPWIAAWEDVLCRRLVVRFTLLRSAFHLHQASKGRSECQCICSPTLPSAVNPGSSLLKDIIYSISSIIEGREKLFGL